MTTVWLRFHRNTSGINVDTRLQWDDDLPARRDDLPMPKDVDWSLADCDSGTFTEYIAEMDSYTFGRFARDYSLDTTETIEPDAPGTVDYLHDGMDWNVGGVTPYAYVRTTVQHSDSEVTE